MSNQTPSNSERVVLIIGACGLDRLLSVPTYPNPDAKVRTTSYSEVGGGNAANTADCMGRLKNASFLQGQDLTIRLLTKIGSDSVGDQLLDELRNCNVDTTSPFLLRPPASTTSFTTIIVSLDDHTRTCIHTPGTSGELQPSELDDMDAIFENVVHFHSDSRHTDASLLLAKEAKRRGIPVSCDVEKDRKTKALDELMLQADLLFTNSNYLGSYLTRLHRELEEERDGQNFDERELTVSNSTNLAIDTVDKIIKSMTPSTFYTRWYTGQAKKHVVVTQGHMGSILYKPRDATCESMNSTSSKTNKATITQGFQNHSLDIVHGFSDAMDGSSMLINASYRVETAGVLENVTIVDSTGAGDAFIGGYILGLLVGNDKFALDFASWVAGKKLQGPGARSALPWGSEVDTELGNDMETIEKSLASSLTPFNKEESLA